MRYILIFLVGFYSLLNAQILEVEQLFNKKLTQVKKELVTASKSFYGQTSFDERKVYDIVTRFDGFVTKLNANEKYKYIKKGETLFEVYSDDIVSIQQELQIGKKVNNSLVKSSIEKLKSLDIDNFVINKIKNSNNVIKDIPILSPTSGIVLEKSINDGSFVKKGKLLLQMVSLDQLWFIASVYQKDLSYIKKGMDAKIYIDGIANPVDSKVDFIYPDVDEKTKSVKVRFIVPNKDLKLYANMFAKVDIKYEQKEMLTLPKTAVLRKGNNFFVFGYLSKTEYEPIQIEAKRISSNRYEILSGVEEGQKVINNALFLLDSDAITNGLYSSDDEDW
jgi:Cu(I)/Ag(I) efflux system membrane fusion protein